MALLLDCVFDHTGKVLSRTNARLSGVYAIHGPARHVYIGQSVNVWGRWSEHLDALENRYHSLLRMQAHWNAYGRSAFRFQLVERVKPFSKLLLKREEAMMLAYASNGYKLYNKALPFPARVSTEFAARAYWQQAQGESINYGSFIGERFQLPSGSSKGQQAKVKKINVAQNVAILRVCGDTKRRYVAMPLTMVALILLQGKT